MLTSSARPRHPQFGYYELEKILELRAQAETRLPFARSPTWRRGATTYHAAAADERTNVVPTLNSVRTELLTRRSRLSGKPLDRFLAVRMDHRPDWRLDALIAGILLPPQLAAMMDGGI